MCTIAILIDVVEGAPIVLAANRDELYARPTRPPELLSSSSSSSSPPIVGGVDALSGGTWLAIRADGHFAAVTNQRVLVTPPPGLRSRGHAVAELAASSDPDGYVAAIDPAAYASMNLVWRSRGGVSIAYARREARTLDVVQLSRGVHVLCNDRLGAAGFPRGERLQRGIEAALERGAAWPALATELAALLGDHDRAPPPDATKATDAKNAEDAEDAEGAAAADHLSPELARALTAVCIHSPHYGTRSSTIAALAPERVIEYRYTDGPPCTAPFVGGRALMEAR